MWMERREFLQGTDCGVEMSKIVNEGQLCSLAQHEAGQRYQVKAVDRIPADDMEYVLFISVCKFCGTLFIEL